MNTINVENCKTLLIGRRGENDVTTVAFDFTEWASEFGSGVVDLYVKHFGDESAYPVVLTIDGTVASWLVTETDTNVAGYGKAEYVYRVDGKIAKSAVFPFFVAEDIGQPASEPPDPYESWLEQLTALGAETEAHAQAAEQSAENSAESAEDAAQSAASAEGYAGQAETAAGLAQAAQTASEAARDAAQTAQASAEASATAASGSAASAASSATAAAGSASDASASATAAGASATTASTAATQAEAAKTAAQTAQSAAEDAAEDAQQAAQQAHVEYEQLSGEVDDLSDEVSQQKSAIEDLEALTNRKAGMLVDSVSGAIASFTPDATIPDLLGVSVDIEPVQAGSGDPSPDNVRPISGWDSVEVEAAGKNLFDPNGDYSLIPCYNYRGSAQSRRGKILHLPVGTYSLSVVAKQTGVEAYININIINSDGTLALFQSVVNATNLYNRTITITNGQTLAIYDQQATTATSDVKFTQFDFQLEPGSTASAYRPHAGNRYTLQLGQTVYGGTLDVTNGTMTVDRAMVDLGTLEWSYSSTYSRFGTRSIDTVIKPPSTNNDVANCLCTRYKTVSDNATASSLNDNSIGISVAGRIDVRDTLFTDAATFKAAMSGVQLCYELATPITITLDHVTISTISGQTNNVWADAGDVSVEYAADLKHYIDSKIAAAVAALS